MEFAAQRHRDGLSIHDAALEAARLRFRPIVMTSLAFILGVLPLAISTGARSASRHSIGTGVIGGMIAATPRWPSSSCRCSSRLVTRRAEQGRAADERAAPAAPADH